MAPHICSIVPPHLLQHVADSPENGDTTKSIYRNTLFTTQRIRANRAHHPAADPSQQALNSLGESSRNVVTRGAGIVPPFVLSELASRQAGTREGEAAQATLAHRLAGTSTKAGTLARTIYDMEKDPNYSNLPGDVVLIREGGAPVSKKADPTEDPNECYQGFKDTYNFFKEVFGRKSIDNKGLKLIGSVHFGDKYQNAFWDGKQMVFGDGDGKILRDFTSRADVIGHELTHGITQYTADLAYENQSGALNESMSDCFGIMVKQYKLGQTAEQSNWIIGEGIWGPGIKGVGLRSMKAPGTAYDDPRVGKDPQPATMSAYQDLPNDENNDNGGVHINSGIPNYAFYLVATKIGGHAWKTAGPIWYRVLTGGKLKTNATFQEFANETLAEAGEYKAQVTEAWGEVGITVSEAVNPEL